MVSLLSPRPSRLARPSLEWLESRDVLSTLTLSVTYGLGRSITMSGDLSGTGQLGQRNVVLGGQVSGYTVTDSFGHYEIIVNAAALGNVTAQMVAEPGANDSSNVATFTLTDEPPVITDFVAIEMPGHLWILRGTVTYFRVFESLTINFGGSPVSIRGLTTNADGTGHFELGVILNGTQTDNGTATAQAVSPWGTLSELATDWIFQTGT